MVNVGKDMGKLELLCVSCGNANGAFMDGIYRGGSQHFSFALGRGVSPHSHFSAYHLTGVSLTLDVGYLYTACPVKHSRRS